MSHVHVGMACKVALIMLHEKKQSETILKWQSIKHWNILKIIESILITNLKWQFKKETHCFGMWLLVVQKTSLFDNVRQTTLETWEKNKCDKIKSLNTNWMITSTSIIPINDTIKRNTTLPLLCDLPGQVHLGKWRQKSREFSRKSWFLQ